MRLASACAPALQRDAEKADIAKEEEEQRKGVLAQVGGLRPCTPGVRARL